jgi:hypothetical protein
MRFRGIDEITSKRRSAKVAGRGTCHCPEGSVLSKTKKGTMICARRRPDAPVFAKKSADGKGCARGAQKKKFKSKDGFYCLARRPGWLWAGAPVCDIPAPKGAKKRAFVHVSTMPGYRPRGPGGRFLPADSPAQRAFYPASMWPRPRGPGGRFVKLSGYRRRR